MKTININGKEFFYEVCYHVSEYGEYVWTEFYDGSYTKTYKKYFFFGPTRTKEVYNKVFQLNFNIEDKNKTKSDIRKSLERQIELMNREEEIKRGELI